MGTYRPDDGVGQTPDDGNATFQLVNDVAIYGGFAGNEAYRALCRGGPPEVEWEPCLQPADCQGGLGHHPIQDRSQSDRRATASPTLDTASIPWRLELSTNSTQEKLTNLFLRAP